MSVCSATAAASSYPRGRPGRSSSTARASITEQLIERTEQTKNLSKKRASTARPSITEQLMERTDKSRMPQRPRKSSGSSTSCCVICILAVIALVGGFYISHDSFG